MKKMRLDDIYPATYILLHSGKRFRKKREKTLAATRHPPHYFKTALKPCGISKSVQHVEVAPNP